MMLKHLLLVIVAKTQAPDRIDTGLKARITEFSCTAERHGLLKSSGVQMANGNLKRRIKSINISSWTIQISMFIVRKVRDHPFKTSANFHDF